MIEKNRVLLEVATQILSGVFASDLKLLTTLREPKNRKQLIQLVIGTARDLIAEVDGEQTQPD